MIRLLFFILYLLCYKLSYTQKIATIPFEELYGGVMLIKAKVGNYPDTLNFIFDTGSSHISLDSTTAAEMEIKSVAIEKFVRGIGGVHKVTRTEPMSLNFKGLKVDSLSFSVNDYTVLQESYGQRIDGIIGFAFINKFLFNVNFDSSLIHVYKRGSTYKRSKRGFLWNFTLPFLPTAIIDIKDEKSQNPELYIDCGAGLSLLLDEKYYKDSSFISPKRKIINAQIEGTAGAAKAKLTVVKQVKLGPYKFKNVPTYLYDDENGLLNYPQQKGLIGNEILRRFNWWLDYGKSQVFLMPNKSYFDPFDYAYTGLSIFLMDGVVTVTEVIKGSPGEASGFLVGDVILSMDNTIATSVRQVKESIQSTKRRVKVIVIRDDKVITLTLKVDNIL